MILNLFYLILNCLFFISMKKLTHEYISLKSRILIDTK